MRDKDNNTKRLGRQNNWMTAPSPKQWGSVGLLTPPSTFRSRWLKADTDKGEAGGRRSPMRLCWMETVPGWVAVDCSWNCVASLQYMILFLVDWSMLRWKWQKGRVEGKAPPRWSCDGWMRPQLWVTVKYLGQYAASLEFTTNCTQRTYIHKTA